MKTYKGAITLNRNNRGCYILDTVKGCPGGALHGGRGCYGDCYAKNIASRYGFAFDNPVSRNFENNTDQLWLFGLTDKTHTTKIIDEISNADMPFIRIGEMGDPSSDWGHTINICREIYRANKKIVIITKHWGRIPDKFLSLVSRMGLFINTSVSALDDERLLNLRVREFERLKNICHSILRIVSCDFNTEHQVGNRFAAIQHELFKMAPYIDTVFRPNGGNGFVVDNIINTKKEMFLSKYALVSRFNQNAYLGYCGTCPDLCGISNT